MSAPHLRTGSNYGKGHCQLCLLKSSIEHAPGHDQAARDFEACANRRVAADAERAPWRTQCGRDQPLDWHDANGAIAAVEDLRGELRRQDMVQRIRLDEANRLVTIRNRREAMLKTSRERAQRNHQSELALRSVDPSFLHRIQALQQSHHQPSNSMDESPGEDKKRDNQRHVKNRPWSARTTSTTVGPITGTAAAAATAIRTPPDDAIFSGWTRQKSIQSLTLSESKRLGVPSPRPTSVLDHLMLAEKVGTVQMTTSAADRRRAMPLPSPVVIVSPRLVAAPPVVHQPHPPPPSKARKNGDAPTTTASSFERQVNRPMV
ncbi:Hypothetical protein, putative [Bodo saltans]|uniref:Uncharacterized protein n=1 Tax=Bodo saltans TaxID=75058 RepID=A0A0S4JJ27_BODSA|nr:Hypothetical protein, putative [Bodo saltans]|eukprot:CUG89399.1 Hypothetical protein, putative [Bodo saltans]